MAASAVIINYLNKTTMLQYGYNFRLQLKEVAKAARNETYN